MKTVEWNGRSFLLQKYQEAFFSCNKTSIREQCKIQDSKKATKNYGIKMNELAINSYFPIAQLLPNGLFTILEPHYQEISYFFLD